MSRPASKPRESGQGGHDRAGPLLRVVIATVVSPADPAANSPAAASNGGGGCPLRAAKRKRHPEWTEKQTRIALEMRAADATSQEIADALGRTEAGVRNRFAWLAKKPLPKPAPPPLPERKCNGIDHWGMVCRRIFVPESRYQFRCDVCHDREAGRG